MRGGGRRLLFPLKGCTPLPFPSLLPRARFHAFRFMYLYITIRERFREPSIHLVYFVSTEG